MSTLEEIQKLDEACHFQVYKRYPILLERGEGARVWDSTGKEYIDMLAGIAVNALGHAHPAVLKALTDQAGRLMHCSNLYYTEPQARLARLLVEQSGLDRVFFCNSGTEAIEGAIKLARKWATRKGRGGTIVSMEGSFHGRSLAALTATGQPKYKEGLEPLPGGFTIVPFNDLQAVDKVLDDTVCAVLVEPVQGEGGIRPADPAYLEGLRKLCDERGALLIFDEIQCGIGRTGTTFAYQGYGVVPDVVTIAKALGAGFPIGAFLAKQSVAECFKPGDHGTTFGGNPLACAVAFAALSTIVNEKLPERSRDLGGYLMESLRKKTAGIDAVKEVRGRGLMVGVVLDRSGKEVVNAMMERGVLSNCTADTVIRLVPPLVISRADLDAAVDVLVGVLEEAFPNA